MFKTESSSSFKFDQDLPQETSMSGHLDEIIPRQTVYILLKHQARVSFIKKSQK